MITGAGVLDGLDEWVGRPVGWGGVGGPGICIASPVFQASLHQSDGDGSHPRGRPLRVDGHPFRRHLRAYIPLLPDEYQELLREAQKGDWETRQQRLLELVEGFGPAKPYIFLTLQVLQVVFAPIPGQLIGLLAGHFFGFWRGLFLSMLGLAIGSFLAMGLGRLLGEKLVRR